ncbi:ROK family transcriptional regulator [Paeniglutamicibacter sp. ABSL32-1]|uniref:ROK family transcriptional regulator n=1 Tax=Paeniglutamicibacter quisquiliarum TaxID=2849498 RepID=UPI001C2D394F|nr:ROK family transcriptional regulator [Paeniglutamicibacter quisquiliarum]MBV1780916.1 ROK family transcriptional regulator [Paeniglutamicibacter quisquiliarum]
MSADQRNSTAGTNPGSQSALRGLNEERVMAMLRSHGTLTQAALARATGLSTATISNIVKSLVAANRVEATPTTSSGRRALGVSLIDAADVAVGIDFGRSHVRVVLARSGFRLLGENHTALPVGHRAEESISVAAGMLRKLREELGIEHGQLLGAGIGIPGPIDHRTMTVIRGAILPEWVGIDIESQLQAALDLPVFIDNDANLGALAQITWGEHQVCPNLCFLKIGSGIGSGLILNGSLHYGSLGVTGEIGHSTIFDQGLICRCGNRGCLETVASTGIIIELLSRAHGAPVTIEGIIEQARAGDSATLRIIGDMGAAVGHALANVANLLSPEVIVIGGPLAPLGEILLEPIRRGLLRHAIPVIGENTVVRMALLGDRAEALGAAALVLRHSHSPAGTAPQPSPLQESLR